MNFTPDNKQKIKKNDTNDIKSFVSSSEYLTMCKRYLQEYNSPSKSNPYVNVQISQNNGYIVNNKKVTINMTPDIVSNVQDMIDFDGDDITPDIK